MRRREFIAAFAGAAVRPLSGYAQQPERRVGVLMPWPENDPMSQVSKSAFAGALQRLGWAEGRNIRIDYRFGGGDPALSKVGAAELVSLSPDVILAGATPAVVALQQQTQTIPIVFVLIADPVERGFVQSLARPGGDITGFSSFDAPLMGKWLQLLKQIAPRVRRVSVIYNPGTAPYAALFNNAIQAAGTSLNVPVTFAPVHDDAAIETAVAAQAYDPGGGLISLPDSFTTARRAVIIAAAIRHRLPLMGAGDPFARDGALMSYWFDMADLHAQAASYVDRILRGAKPADLPVQQPTKYSLIINLKTAKALGLTVPDQLLELADEVIE
ncbi:MAG: ABC transporter substrate-binding protein [Acetobacteraceae bacterium]|nr:ABC transporter substrate-binding protein [Acetobacteraceae bacterium]